MEFPDVILLRPLSKRCLRTTRSGQMGIKKHHDYQTIKVEDNGIGMNEAVKNRCLEPFYTRKEVGEGTGLGLSVSYGIVRELNFYLDIDSRENVGSLFRVIIPLQQDDHRE